MYNLSYLSLIDNSSFQSNYFNSNFGNKFIYIISNITNSDNNFESIFTLLIIIISSINSYTSDNYKLVIYYLVIFQIRISKIPDKLHIILINFFVMPNQDSFLMIDIQI